MGREVETGESGETEREVFVQVWVFRGGVERVDRDGGECGDGDDDDDCVVRR